MKKVVFGGLLFVGGCVLFSLGTLGIADTTVAAYLMKAPQYLGMFFMLAGLVLGFSGLRKDD